MSEEKKEGGITFHLPTKYVLLLFAFVLGVPVGSFTYATKTGGTPAETTVAVNNQTQTLAPILTNVQNTLQQLKVGQDENTQAIEANNRGNRQRMDSLYSLTMDGLQNLDGYFRGRLDQMQDQP